MINGFYDKTKYKKNCYDIIKYIKNNNEKKPIIIFDFDLLKIPIKNKHLYFSKFKKKNIKLTTMTFKIIRLKKHRLIFKIVKKYN